MASTNRLKKIDTIALEYLRGNKILDTVVNAIQKYGEDNIRIDTSYDYDPEHQYAVLKCSRDETDEEFDVRVNSEKVAALNQEQREREAYERLKKKFEGK